LIIKNNIIKTINMEVLPIELKRLIHSYIYEECCINIWENEKPLKERLYEMVDYYDEESILEWMLNEVFINLPKYNHLKNDYFYRSKERINGIKTYIMELITIDNEKIIDEIIRIMNKEKEEKNYKELYKLYINYLYMYNEMY
jgi:hypothetical protein